MSERIDLIEAAAQAPPPTPAFLQTENGQSSRLLSLQASRGIAAVIVVLSHANSIAQVRTPVLTGGNMAVEFFFALSGFIIFYVHSADIGHPAKLFPYARKRILKLYPIYWIISAILIPAVTFAPSMTSSVGKTDYWLIARSLLLLPTQETPFLGVTWSLQHEVFFYAVFGLMILTARAFWLVPIWGALLLLAVFVKEPAFPFSFLFKTINLDFLAGIAAAISFTRYPVPNHIKRLGLMSGTILGTNYCLRLFNNTLPLPLVEPLFGCACALFIYAAAISDRFNVWRVPRTLVLLGNASYSIYLIHYPVELLSSKLVGSGPFSLVLISVLGVVAGLAVHLLVENPVSEALRARRAH